MTGRALWLPHALRTWGVDTIVWDGWEHRGAPDLDPAGVVLHHTATRIAPERDVHLCIGGRPDLPGPLCHVVLDRQGRAHVIASGVANHAGQGSWRGLAGNRRVLGIEASNTGVGEPWPAVQVDAYERVVAAMLDHLGRDSGWACAHREWTARKIDPAGIDMDGFRARVQVLLDTGGDIVRPEDVTTIALKSAEATAAVLRPIIREEARAAVRDAFSTRAADGTRRPGGLIRRLRRYLRRHP